jgi:hypothetical protein
MGVGYPLLSPDLALDLFKRRICGWGLCRGGGRRPRALKQSIEEQSAMARAAPVEAKRELVEVVVELVVADRALVRAEQPALDQRSDAVDVRHDHVGGVAWGRHVRDDVREGVAADVEVALPAIGAHLRSAGDVVEHEGGQRRLGDVGYAPHAHPPDASPRSSTAIATIGLPGTPRPAAPGRRAPK